MSDKGVSLKSAIAHYVASITRENYSPRTVDLYRSVLEKSADGLGRSPTVDDLNLDSALEFQLKLQNKSKYERHPFHQPDGKCSPHYVNLNCRILRGFSSWIRRHGYTRENALEHFHPGRLPQKEKVPLTPGEQQALFSSIKGDSDQEVRRLTLVLTLLDTGLRASELCGIEMEDLDLETGEMRVRDGKGAKDRHVAVGMRTLAALHNYVF